MQILCPKFPLHFIYCFLQVLESLPIPLYPVDIFISPVRLQIFKGETFHCSLPTSADMCTGSTKQTNTAA